MFKSDVVGGSDVLIVKRYLEEYHPHIEGLQAVPSLDIRPLLPFFSPESCFLKVDPCEVGHLESSRKVSSEDLEMRRNDRTDSPRY